MKRKLSWSKILGLTVFNVLECILKIGRFVCEIFGVICISYFWYNHVLLDIPPTPTYFECEVLYNGSKTDIFSCTELKITSTNETAK